VTQWEIDDVMPSVTNEQDARIGEQSTVTVKVLLVLIGWIVAALMAYSAFDSRVARLEDRYDRIQVDISEVKGDVKQLLRQAR
jgi:hypothetical protein